MTGPLSFRDATVEDAPFLTEAILAAEALPGITTPMTMYERIFDLSRAEVEELVLGAVSAEGRGHALTYGTFGIIERDGTPLATCAGWVEGATGQASGLGVAMIVSRFIGSPRWRARSSITGALSRCAPRRTANMLQLESFYVTPSSRGMGLTGMLIDETIRKFHARSPVAEQAEIVLLRENAGALRAYAKAGFSIAAESPEPDPALRAVTGSAGFLLLRRTLT